MNELLAEYAALLARVDAWFAGALAAYPDDITCHRGCSACCSGLFDITLPDAALLKSGFDLLPSSIREALTAQAQARIDALRKRRPEFVPPYLLDGLSEEGWLELLAEFDDSPCLLLDPEGLCLLYAYRPMTCRLHGLPLMDLTGELHDDACCTLNFIGQEPLQLTGLRGEFTEILSQETSLVAEFNLLATGIFTAQRDTLIPAALLVDHGAGAPHGHL